MSDSPILAIILLFCTSLMTGIATALQRIGKTQAELIAKHQVGPGKFLFKKRNRDLLTYAIALAKSTLLICFSLFAFDFILTDHITIKTFLLALLIVVSSFLFTDYLFRILSALRPRTFFKVMCQPASVTLIIFWPLAIPLYKILGLILPTSSEKVSYKDKILEILHASEFSSFLDPNDQKLFLSVISFKERIAREVMVPRIDMYTLNCTTSLKVAANRFLEEGYSRIPVWKENVDNIIGTLYYKDLFRAYFNASAAPKDLEGSIEPLLKPIVYAPETKKISQLLQEFRNKQIHLAIVVDEYGGTEGIVTIEDILEQLVGEIGDEYDYGEEALYTVLPSGGWILDAKMTIIDIENELGITIPQSPEYDTIGGYIFHKAGAIPSKGWRLHQDDFELEVLSSSERTIDKIKIAPH
ncbi:MAG: HlyC/CorC family transporter [Verrucomicrobia bacterium]|nr:HlyC/CorC family transporter [Verrucomicrobiota bacterium]